MIKKLITIFVLAIAAAGCTSELSYSSDDDQKEYILTQLNDYQGLIEIYRNRLSTRDNPGDRYYLSELYNKIGDYSSSNIYLQPLLETSPESRYLILHVKNLLELGREKECGVILKELLANDASSGELWNLQGVLLAQQGRYDQAIQSFVKARGLFYNEEVVINNLAMMEILQRNYPKARDYLLDLYSRKKYQRQTVYNLIYTLAKTNDDESARKIITDEKLTANEPYKLINALKRITPKEQFDIINADVSFDIQNKVQPGEGDVPKPEISPVLAPDVRILKTDEPKQTPTSPTELACNPLPTKTTKPAPFVGKIENAKLISAMSGGKVRNGNTLSMYSSYALNYVILPQETNNQLRIQLFNAMPSASLYSNQLSILKKYQDINGIEFLSNNDNSITLVITTNKCIVSKNVTRASGNKKHKEKLLINFQY